MTPYSVVPLGLIFMHHNDGQKSTFSITVHFSGIFFHAKAQSHALLEHEKKKRKKKIKAECCKLLSLLEESASSLSWSIACWRLGLRLQNLGTLQCSVYEKMLFSPLYRYIFLFFLSVNCHGGRQLSNFPSSQFYPIRGGKFSVNSSSGT